MGLFLKPEKEQTIVAQLLFFSNESFAWVIGDNGIDGTLIDKNGSIKFRS